MLGKHGAGFSKTLKVPVAYRKSTLLSAKGANRRDIQCNIALGTPFFFFLKVHIFILVREREQGERKRERISRRLVGLDLVTPRP